MSQTTLVLGASSKPDRYSCLAIHSLVSRNHRVIAVGRREAVVNGVLIQTSIPQIIDCHTITLYLNPSNQEVFYDQIISLVPKRIIFNPGSENEALRILAKKNGIEVVYGCTIIMLTTGNY
ncbi:MAG: CoA-binding protein [Bacteroidota bacterium]